MPPPCHNITRGGFIIPRKQITFWGLVRFLVKYCHDFKGFAYSYIKYVHMMNLNYIFNGIREKILINLSRYFNAALEEVNVWEDTENTQVIAKSSDW